MEVVTSGLLSYGAVVTGLVAVREAGAAGAAGASGAAGTTGATNSAATWRGQWCGSRRKERPHLPFTIVSSSVKWEPVEILVA